MSKLEELEKLYEILKEIPAEAILPRYHAKIYKQFLRIDGHVPEYKPDVVKRIPEPQTREVHKCKNHGCMVVVSSADRECRYCDPHVRKRDK